MAWPFCGSPSPPVKWGWHLEPPRLLPGGEYCARAAEPCVPGAGVSEQLRPVVRDNPPGGAGRP